MRWLPIPLLFAFTAFGEDTPPPFRIASETVPPGGIAQIKVYADPPQSISSGSITLNFDPAVFGTVTQASVFSAAGDAVGVGRGGTGHLFVVFSARSGGIGQLPGLPVLQVSVPVLPTATPGSKVTIDGNATGTVTIGGSLSVRSVTPGVGVQPSGTVITVEGTGFSPGTTVDLEGTAISAPRCVNPQACDITLNQPTELTGKRLVVTNQAGEHVEYFLAAGSLANLAYLSFPTRNVRSIKTYGNSQQNAGTSYGFLNPYATPVTLTSESTTRQSAVTIPPHGVFTMFGAGRGDFSLETASAPIRVLGWEDSSFFPLNRTFEVRDRVPVPDKFVVSSPPALDWGPGMRSPLRFDVSIRFQGDALQQKPVEAVVSSGAPWLSIESKTGDACNNGLLSCGGVHLLASVNPIGLPPGDYTGTILITAQDRSLTPATAVVNLSVRAFSMATSPAYLIFLYDSPPASVMVTGNPDGDSISAKASTQSGGNWLTVTPSSAAAPASFTVSVNPSGLAKRDYFGAITISSGEQTTIIPVLLSPYTPPTAQVSFTYLVGGEAPKPYYTFLFDFCSPFTDPPTCGSDIVAAVKTDSGGDWLSARVYPASAAEIKITADPTGLKIGKYTGTVTLSNVDKKQVFTAGLIVTDTPLPPPIPPPVPPLAPPSGPLSVQPVSANLVLDFQRDNQQLLSVAVGGAPAVFEYTVQSDPGLAVDAKQQTGLLSLNLTPMVPGVQHASVTITSGGQSVTVPITITSQPVDGPVMGSVVNAASQRIGPVAPGEIISLHGSEVGFVKPDLSQVRVLFDDIPATILYGAQWQINAIVPNTLAGRQATQMRVEVAGLRSPTWGLPVAPASPAIFTLNGTGVGQAAVLNQDNSVNGDQQPASAGSVIQIFGTGAGLSLTPSVKVTIGGIDARVLFAGQAPGAVKGLFQVNAVVPSGLTPGTAQPLMLSVDGTPSQNGVTVAIN